VPEHTRHHGLGHYFGCSLEGPYHRRKQNDCCQIPEYDFGDIIEGGIKLKWGCYDVNEIASSDGLIVAFGRERNRPAKIPLELLHGGRMQSASPKFFLHFFGKYTALRYSE
jgi:hypothetical protein